MKKQQQIVEHYLARSRFALSGYSFVNIFAWMDFFEFDFQLINDHLCIFAENEVGCFLYLPPLGLNVAADTIDECFQRMTERNKGSGVTRIENVTEDQLALYPPQHYKLYLKSHEYIYRRADLSKFQGRAYKSKRSGYNHFVKHYSFEFQPFQPGMRRECLALYDEWAQDRRKRGINDIDEAMLEQNRLVHEKVMSAFEELGLIGRVVTVNGTIKGYTFGYALNQDTFCVLFEITDLSVKGLAVYIFRAFCQDPALAAFSWINAMDDFGLENIQQTKRSFRPASLVASYTVTPQLTHH
ncbi:MAG: phosphatidylglycerol lysyltransferase domain-containing protein [Candidatus Omnitrophota bacterium]|nr:phosphatidylglycerol lysyltransferase domain-containing protein [Candidatus Omnitrophota bacterium]